MSRSDLSINDGSWGGLLNFFKHVQALKIKFLGLSKHFWQFHLEKVREDRHHLPRYWSDQKSFGTLWKDATFLYWTNYDGPKITASDVIDPLNLLPNLQSLNLEHFNDIENYNGDCEFKLKNLTEIKIEDQEPQLH